MESCFNSVRVQVQDTETTKIAGNILYEELLISITPISPVRGACKLLEIIAAIPNKINRGSNDVFSGSKISDT